MHIRINVVFSTVEFAMANGNDNTYKCNELGHTTSYKTTDIIRFRFTLLFETRVSPVSFIMEVLCTS